MANQDGAYRLLLLSREIPRRSSGVVAEFDAKWLCYPSAQREFAMKRAEAMLEELVRHVRPPRGCAIVLTEYKSTGSTDPNWVAASGNMELQKLICYSEKIAKWRWTDPQIDWSGVKVLAGQRRMALWLSEADSY